MKFRSRNKSRINTYNSYENIFVLFALNLFSLTFKMITRYTMHLKHFHKIIKKMILQILSDKINLKVQNHSNKMKGI